MNEQQPYEKHFTEKMRQLPVPDANRTWQQMHALLDKEMPPGSSGIGGSGTRWWMISVGAGIIFAGTWFSGRQFLSGNRHKNTVASTRVATDSAASIVPLTVNDSLTKNNSHQKIIHGDTSTLIIKQFPAVIPGENDGRNHKMPQSSAHDVAGMPNGLSNTTGNNSLPSVPGSKKGDVEKNSSHPERRRAHQGANEVAANNKGRRSHAGDQVRNEVKQRSRADHTTRGARLNDNGGTAGNRQPGQSSTGHHNKRSDNEIAKNNKVIQSAAGKQENDKAQQRDDHNDLITRSTGKESMQKADSKPDEEVVKASSVSVYTGYPDLYAISPYIVFDEVMDNDYVTASLPPRTERITSSSHRTRSRSAASSNERVFTAGVTLPIGLPLGNQQTVGYNINAMPNTISDYLPMPHFQYHFNSRLYAQAEFQMLSPQYIPEVCVEQRRVFGGPNPVFSSYYAKKLYYFSLPLSIHYSPVRNVYVGTGLQYSRFISGVAGITESYLSPGGPVTFYKNYVRFTNAYRSSSIKSDELKVLLEVNYYRNRFTVGMRYNQALGNYVIQHIPGTQDYTNDKNKAFQFYIRYNLFETLRRPKQSVAQRLLTFK